MTNNMHRGRLTSGSWWFDKDVKMIVDPLVRLTKHSEYVEAIRFEKDSTDDQIIIAQITFDKDRYTS